MNIPDTLAHKIRHFKSSGRVVKYGGDLFATPNWLAVFMGQEIWPERYDTLVDQRDAADMRANLQRIRAAIRRTAEAAPRHEEYLANQGHMAAVGSDDVRD